MRPAARFTLPLLLATTACGPDAPPRPSSPSGTASGPRPDILLVSIDSLRADHLGCYGYAKPTSPNLDRFAREGVRCADAVSTTSWTLPAHAALFTGLHDTTHGVVDNGLALSPKLQTLAEVLRAAGYRTAGFYGGPYLHPVYGLAQGFETWECCMGEALAMPPEKLVESVLTATERMAQTDVTGPRTLELFTRRLMVKPRDEPLFAFVHLWDVHYDYVPPEEHWRRFDPDWKGELDCSDVPRNAALHAQMPKRDLEHFVALYDGEIAATDALFAQLLAAWEQARGRDTLVVVTADHGEEFFEHGGKGHQRSLFEESVRVPLIFRWPGRFDGGRVVEPLVRLIDVCPTLAAAGLGEMPKLQGNDLGPLLTGSRVELPIAPALMELLVDGGEIRALRRGKSKTIRYKDARLRFAIDLASDPGEERPLPEDSDAMKKGLAELDAVLESARALARELDAPPLRIDPGRAIQRALKGLGYAGEDEETSARR